MKPEVFYNETIGSWGFQTEEAGFIPTTSKEEAIRISSEEPKPDTNDYSSVLHDLFLDAWKPQSN